MKPKQHYSEAAEIKTRADYALVLEHVNGYSKQEAQQAATEDLEGESFYDELLRRNTELFRTGEIIIK